MFPETITRPDLVTVDDVRAWFRELRRARIIFHPEDSFADTITRDSWQPAFTPEDARRMDLAMGTVYAVCDEAGEDPCAVALEVIRDDVRTS